MFWIIVLLKVSLPLFHSQCLKAFHQTILQNLTILFSIHLPLKLYKISYPISAHTAPYHQVIPPFMFDCWSCSSIRKLLSPYFHTYAFPSDPIQLIFVSFSHKTLLKSSTAHFDDILQNVAFIVNVSCSAQGLCSLLQSKKHSSSKTGHGEVFNVPHIFCACLCRQAWTMSDSVRLCTDSQISNLANVTLQQ